MKKKAAFPFIMTIGLSLIILSNSCNYYKPITKPVSPYSFDVIEQQKKQEYKALILQSPQRAYLLSNFSFDLKEEKVTATLAQVPRGHFTYLNNEGRADRYRKSNDDVLQEVHLYTDLVDLGAIGDQVEISISDITKLEVIEKNTAKSTGITVLAVSAAALSLYALIYLIAYLLFISAVNSAANSSCPYISVYDGDSYVLQGETFGGAIIPVLAREDFLPLPDISMDKDLKLMISNELKERQYTDMADLLVVEHHPDESVFMDPAGNLFKSTTFYKPTNASINNEIDILFPLSEVDNIACTFNEDNNDPVNELYVNFDNPSTKSQYGLLLSLKNNYWLEFVIAEFYSAFGEKYSKFVKTQQKKSGKKTLEWIDMQEIMLTVEAKTESGWKEVQKIKTIGPLMNREVLIPLENIAFSDEGLEVRLRTGFMFWELDKISLTELTPISAENKETLKPNSAIDEKNQDVLSPLLANDGVYMEQPEIGNRAYLTYRFENYNPNKTYSTFLHSRGYYEPIREFTGKADWKFLTQFRNDGMLPAYSLQRFLEISQSQHLTDQSSKKKSLKALKKQN
nr:hypothetical protein [Cytophagales bacterium]